MKVRALLNPTIPTDPDAKLLRVPLAHALNAAGYFWSPATLATLASRGGGPPYVLIGNRAVYTWGPALAWARSRVRQPSPRARRKVGEAA